MKVPLKDKIPRKKSSGRTVGKASAMYCTPGIRRRWMQSKLDQLPPRQKSVLKSWLIKEGVTYREVQKRLLESFGVPISPAALCRFWQRECLSPAAAKKIEKSPDVLLDVILESRRPVRLKILRRQLHKIRVKNSQ